MRSVFSDTLHLAELTSLIPAEESVQFATALSSSSYGPLGSYAVSVEIHGITPKDRNSSAAHLEQFHTLSFEQHMHKQNHVPSELQAPLWC